jgi:hypothetical protein
MKGLYSTIGRTTGRLRVQEEEEQEEGDHSYDPLSGAHERGDGPTETVVPHYRTPPEPLQTPLPTYALTNPARPPPACCPHPRHRTKNEQSPVAHHVRALDTIQNSAVLLLWNFYRYTRPAPPSLVSLGAGRWTPSFVRSPPPRPRVHPGILRTHPATTGPRRPRGAAAGRWMRRRRRLN